MAKPKKDRLVRKSIELTVITFSTWLNPGAILLIAMLQFCFFVLELMQDDEDD